jgi:hypothetical protein
MAKSKSVYHFLPIFDKHLILTNDLDSGVKLVSRYFKDSMLDVEELNELSTVYERAFGLSVVVENPKVQDKQLCYIMHVRDDVDINVVAHEATHITNYILEYIGIPIDIDDEAQAYLNGYIMELFMVEIRGYKRKEGALKRLKK